MQIRFPSFWVNVGEGGVALGLLLLLLDVRRDPVGPLPWGALILLLAIVFVLAVGFVAGLVVFLIWLKRRKANAPVSSQ